MTPHLRYLSYVIRHKYFVFIAGRKLGVSFWQLLIHDWSKFTPAEWGPYVRNFYTDHGNQEDFDRAWLHHQKYNPHHWQYWLLYNDSGKINWLKIPDRYLREMVADWMGAGRAITGKWEVAEWYGKNKHQISIHIESRRIVEKLIREVSKEAR